MTPPWFLPLRLYIGTCPVIEDFPDDHPAFMAARAQLQDLARQEKDLREVPVPGHSEIEARHSRSSCVLLNRKTREIIGGKTTTLVFIENAYRGKGLGAELHVLNDLHLRPVPIILYSKQGLAARIGAHRRHVERALIAGHDVPEDVLEDYRKSETGLALQHPFDIKVTRYA